MAMTGVLVVLSSDDRLCRLTPGAQNCRELIVPKGPLAHGGFYTLTIRWIRSTVELV